MSSIIEKCIDEVNNYIKELGSQSDFAHLKMSIKASISSKAADKVNIESNAYIGIKNSLLANSLISNRIMEIFKDYKGEEKYLFKIEFADLRKSKEKKANHEDIDNEVIEQFRIEKPKHKLSSMVLSQPKWEELNHALALVKNYQKVYKEWGFEEIDPASKTILCFYGKPGTGKTKCAHGIAEHLGKSILCASYADIQSQYVGVGPKNLRNIFRQAETADAVLFFDEADAFLRKRSSDYSSSAAMHYNSMTNEMMKHLEDFNGLVIFATNLTENIDDAFMTRITASIEFLSPDEETRAKLIKELTPAKVPLSVHFSDDDYLKIAGQCEGFVGRDIRNAIKYTLSNAAENGLMEFSPKDFEEGFEQYKAGKDGLDKNINGSQGGSSIYEQIEWNTANAYVLGVCTYMAWYDGAETEEETSKLKEIAKLLNRDKLIITKLSDLLSLEELAEKITIRKQKIETACHAASVLSVTDKENENRELLTQLCTLLQLEDSDTDKIMVYYKIERNKQVLLSEMNTPKQSNINE